MGLQRPARLAPCAFTAVIANWICALLAMIEIDLATNLVIGAAVTSTGAAPSVVRRLTAGHSAPAARSGISTTAAAALSVMRSGWRDQQLVGVRLRCPQDGWGLDHVGR